MTSIAARSLCITITLVLLVDTAAEAQNAGPVLQSSRWPHAAVVIDSDFRFLGGANIQIGSAEADIMVVVDTAGGEVRRLYWVQFEGYPSGSRFTYDYSSLPYADTVGNLLFRSDTRYGAYSQSEIRNELDTGAVVGMLRDHGYEVPSPMMRIRMVALDESRGNELMIIYMESLAVEGLTVSELEADPALWNQVSGGLRQRAISGVNLDFDSTD